MFEYLRLQKNHQGHCWDIEVPVDRVQPCSTPQKWELTPWIRALLFTEFHMLLTSLLMAALILLTFFYYIDQKHQWHWYYWHSYSWQHWCWYFDNEIPGFSTQLINDCEQCSLEIFDHFSDKHASMLASQNWHGRIKTQRGQGGKTVQIDKGAWAWPWKIFQQVAVYFPNFFEETGV